MAVNYKKRFRLMIEKDIYNSNWQRMAGFFGNIFTRLKRNRYVSLGSTERIFYVMKCGVDDILEFVPEEEPDNE